MSEENKSDGNTARQIQGVSRSVIRIQGSQDNKRKSGAVQEAKQILKEGNKQQDK